jgi:hypothetical protein
VRGDYESITAARDIVSERDRLRSEIAEKDRQFQAMMETQNAIVSDRDVEIANLNTGLELQADRADKLIAEKIDMEEKIAKLTAKLHEVRPFADAYKRVCQTLGIENDIIGFVKNLNAERDRTREALVDIHEYWNRDSNDKAMYDACNHAIEIAQAAIKEGK